MAQKKYQQLRDKNRRAAVRIYEYLKRYKVMDEKTFAALYFNKSIEEAHYYPPFDGSYNNRVHTTKQFLIDHGLATFQLVNGLRVIAATQKCWRTKSFATATQEVQEVTNSDIDKAIQYVTLNNNQIPVEYEAPIVANILKLEGEHWKIFVNGFKTHGQYMPEYLDIKYKVLGALDYLTRNGLAVKI
jgi:hypothetical protein